MRIADLATAQRPRERLAMQGAEALADRELLAILLGTGGLPGVGAHTLAEQLLSRFGSVAALARASINKLTSVSGVGAGTRERLVVAVCDQRNRLLGCDIVSDGAADRTITPTREIIVAALRRDGKAFAFAHNHPAGDPSPSDADLVATERVQQAADAVGPRFIDHVVIGDGARERITTAR